MQNPPAKLNQLTFTRFLAALAVVFFHSGGDFGFFKIPAIFTAGLAAVSYFYVLSGFVMAYAYYRPERKLNLLNYGLARFARIYPIYIFAFIVTCFYYINVIPKTRFKEFAANLFLYQAWIPKYSTSYNITAWSLSVEVFFYALVPILIWVVARQPVRRLIWLSVGFWALSQLIHSSLIVQFSSSLTPQFLGYFPIFHLNAFLLGFVGGIWHLHQPAPIARSTSLNIALLILATSATLFALYSNLHYGFGATFSLNVGLLAPLFLIVILTLASDSSFISKFFSHPRLILLGDASYALYILHVPLRWWLEYLFSYFSISLAPEIFLSIYLSSVLIVCVLIYKYVEAPAKDWIRNNPGKFFYFLLDVILIAAMLKLAFIIRLGFHAGGFALTQRFVIFFGSVIFPTLLLILKFYRAYSWRKLALALLTGAILLFGLAYYAWQKGWVEGFPRPILGAAPFYIFLSIYLSRFIIKVLNAKRSLQSKST